MGYRGSMSNPNELIDDATVDARLGEIPGWERRGNALHRDFEFGDFTAAFGFMASVACVAERLFHHPEWSNVWNKVSIAISNHAAGGITEKDFDFAARVNKLAG